MSARHLFAHKVGALGGGNDIAQGEHTVIVHGHAPPSPYLRLCVDWGGALAISTTHHALGI